jgi:hypothetical protein
MNAWICLDKTILSKYRWVGVKIEMISFSFPLDSYGLEGTIFFAKKPTVVQTVTSLFSARGVGLLINMYYL